MAEPVATLQQRETDDGYYACGINGCILAERHPGLCCFPLLPGRRRATRAPEEVEPSGELEVPEERECSPPAEPAERVAIKRPQLSAIELDSSPAIRRKTARTMVKPQRLGLDDGWGQLAASAWSSPRASLEGASPRGVVLRLRGSRDEAVPSPVEEAAAFRAAAAGLRWPKPASRDEATRDATAGGGDPSGPDGAVDGGTPDDELQDAAAALLCVGCVGRFPSSALTEQFGRPSTPSSTASDRPPSPPSPQSYPSRALTPLAVAPAASPTHTPPIRKAATVVATPAPVSAASDPAPARLPLRPPAATTRPSIIVASSAPVHCAAQPAAPPAAPASLQHQPWADWRRMNVVAVPATATASPPTQQVGYAVALPPVVAVASFVPVPAVAAAAQRVVRATFTPERRG